VKLPINGESVAKCTHFRRSTCVVRLDNVNVIYVILVSLVSNDVAKLAFQYEVVQVECLYCRGWEFHRIPL